MRILIVEDDNDLAQFIRKGLQEEGHVIDQAANGEDGFLFASTYSYDLLILDVMLPQLDGMEVCRRLRGKGNTTPILFLTARASIQDKVAGFDFGADDYLTKPFAFAELLVRVRALLRRGRPQTLSPLKAADLELDPVAHRVWRAGQGKAVWAFKIQGHRPLGHLAACDYTDPIA